MTEPLSCPTCGRLNMKRTQDFVDRPDLDTTSRLHTSIRGYICIDCGGSAIRIFFCQPTSEVLAANRAECDQIFGDFDAESLAQFANLVANEWGA
jgi:hypothetical protein